ncbi:MAG: polyprenyl synthetase family protein [Deltaproteobacteria bacterium]|nr:polyprenyl synthetase family protein [Deltaproteobacteria bacterium]MCW8893293.1 polyprenyl synthetase family protein [Deltaproteobacteria bacterium]MCW9048874.1 polyprenyl synthetase family protein [Deltaproteobacteria bacterium]
MEAVIALLKDEMQAVEQQFEKNLASDVQLISQVGQYVLSSGGKRIRPMLLILCSRLCNYRGDKHIELAGVVEFIHTATLLHDDVVDSASLRRGNRSANSVWGNQASVLVGDFLFAKSFSVMVGSESLKILKILSDTTTQLAEGEILQLINTCDLEVNESRYLQVVRDKTAILIAAACQVGGVLAGVDSDQEAALREFGLEIGTAFQLMDDALDYVADQEDFGKEKGHDLFEGKMTLPLIHTYENSSEKECAEISRIVNAEELEPQDLDYVCSLIDAKGGIEYTRLKAQERIEKAKRQLIKFPDCVARQSLFTLADFVVSRTK